MSRLMKLLCVAAASFALVFMCVGYATLSGELSVSGTATYDQNIPPVSVVGAEMIKGHADKLLPSEHTVTSKIFLENGEAVVAITVRNNTDISTDHTEETYGYNSITRYEIDGYLYNTNIEYHAYTDEACTIPVEKGGVIINTSTGATTKKGFTVEPGVGNEETFYLRFSFVEGADTISSEVDSFLSFNFMPLEEIYEDASDEAIHEALEQFGNILNNKVTLSDGTTNSFSALTDQMDKSDENNRSLTDYIGNVTGASPDDKEVIEELFGGKLKINIDGVDTPVTFLIKYDDVYSGAAGDEMTIYMTTENLNEKTSVFDAGFLGIGSKYTPAYAEVYACVFVASEDENGNTLWTPLTDDVVEGTAIVCDYDGGMEYSWGQSYATGSGSFRTDDWRATDGKTISQTVSGL